MTAPLLTVSNLMIGFGAGERYRPAVEGLDLAVERRSTLGIVGESGSGKSVTALAVLGLLPPPPVATVSGSIAFDEQELLGLSGRQLQGLRGRRIAMVFQEPSTALNPVLKVGRQIGEILRCHLGMSRRATRQRAAELLHEVGLPDPLQRLDSYPHELSGGMRQRVMIAMALSCRPALLIADEPTTALDVTVQAQILDLLRRLVDEHRMSMLFISHDLRVIAEVADQVLVMRRGRAVERGPVEDVFHAPEHAYTHKLLELIHRPKEPAGREGP